MGDRVDPDRWDRFERVIRGSRRIRGISDAWGQMLVARGSADVLLEHEPCGVWDLAAARVVLEEASGRMTTLAGGEPFDGYDLLSTNGLVHDEVLKVLVQRA